MKILDGRKVRDFLADKMIRELKGYKIKPKLAIIQVGDNPASSIYIQQKKNFGEKLGFLVEHIHLNKNISQKSVLSQIAKLNKDKKVHGIIIQLPLPKNIDTRTVIEAITSEKDIDGLNSKNLSALMVRNANGFIPATTRGILSLLDFYKISIEGKKVTVVGRSILVGAPIALAFLNRNATVTVCHSKTNNLKDEVKSADIVVVAIGKPQFIKRTYIKRGQVIIDVGITRTNKGILGDVDFTTVSKIVKAISPVPGGVGPMTVVSLFENLLLSYKRQNKLY